MKVTNELLRNDCKVININLQEHKTKLYSIQNKSVPKLESIIENIRRQSRWNGDEIRILLENGFSIFLGDSFLEKCQYIVAFDHNSGITRIDLGERWGNTLSYSGDVPDSVIEKVLKFKSLCHHTHHRDYMGGLQVDELFTNIKILVASTEPLPVATSSPIKTDPFLLAYKHRRDERPEFVGLNKNGKVIERRIKCGEKGFLLLGMWDMDKEIF